MGGPARLRIEDAGITRIGRITGLDVIGLPVWFAARPNSRNLSVAQGKGTNDEAAKIAAIMESVEGASAERTELLTDVTAPITALQAAGEKLLPFEAIFACEPGQLAVNLERRWRRGMSLFTGDPVLSPLELVGLDLRTNSGFDHRAMRISSVGLAAHFDREAALLHGLLEVVENDAVAVLGVFPKAITRFAPIAQRSATHPDLRYWLERLRAAGIAVHLRDITTDIALPCVAAVIAMPGAPDRYAAGYACRFDPQAAALAALMEAIQSRLTQISGARDDMEEESYTGTHALMNVLSPGVVEKCFADMVRAPVAADAPAATGIAHVKSVLREAGVADAYVFGFPPLVDGVAVVKTIITDLQVAFDDGPTRIGPRILKYVMQ